MKIRICVHTWMQIPHYAKLAATIKRFIKEFYTIDYVL